MIKQELVVSTAQFENRSGDKNFNLGVIDEISRQAARDKSQVIAFHECSVTGYSFVRKLSGDQLLAIAEPIPDGPSTRKLIEIAGKRNITILAGLFERDTEDHVYKAQVCVDGNGLIAKHRKLHPFIHPDMTPGTSYTVFELNGWKCGILICYDNNIVENVRATRLLGAEIIFMPHVTMCTPSPRPGAGFVDPALWYNREKDPVSLRAEFDGPKGREWLMKWLPARAYDNGVYVIFSNLVGMDDDQLKNGCSMIIDPFGNIMNECRKTGNDLVTGILTRDKLTRAGGYRYIEARKPELYRDIIGKEHRSEQKVAWLQETDEKSKMTGEQS
jgi:predicted amidohydrolase